MSTGDLKQLGQYEIRGLLGRGSVAKVYRAFQQSLNREVAIKVISSQFVKDQNTLERFKRETQAIKNLRHPNILTIYEFGQEGNSPYLVTELINGRTLREYLGEPQDLRFTSKVLNQLASALDFAHSSGIIHRDVKPTNVLMDARDRVVLSDFGITRILQPEGAGITTAGKGLGTPEYMCPEQGINEPLDGRSDQYSLGVIIYEMLTGTTPFHSDTPLAVLMSHAYKPLPDPLLINPKLPPQVAEVVKKALAKIPAERFRTCSDFARAFEQVISPLFPPEKALPNTQPLIASQMGIDTIAISPLERPPIIAPATGSNNRGVMPQPPSKAATPIPKPNTPIPPGNFPLPLAAVAANYQPPKEKKSRTGLIIGGVAAIVLIAAVIIGIIAITGGSNSGATTQSVVTNTVAATTQVSTAKATTTSAATATTTIANTLPPTTTTVATTATTTEAPTPTLSDADVQLSDALKKVIGGLPSTAAVIVIPTATLRIEQNSTKQTPAGSLIMLWIAATVFDEETAGRIDLAETFTIKATDQVEGTGILKQAQNVGKTLPYSEILDDMLVYSDNTAANIILNHLGGFQKVTDYLKSNNYTQTIIKAKPGTAAEKDNVTSATDLALFLDNLLKKKVVNTNISDKILTSLKSRRAFEGNDTNFFGRLLPDNLEYAHISGILPNVRNDMGFYIGKNRSVIVIILLSDITNEADSETAIGNVLDQIFKAVP